MATRDLQIKNLTEQLRSTNKRSKSPTQSLKSKSKSKSNSPRKKREKTQSKSSVTNAYNKEEFQSILDDMDQLKEQISIRDEQIDIYKQ